MDTVSEVKHLRNFGDAVLPFMEVGIRSVRRLASTVLAMDPNNMKLAYDNIRRAIEKANTNFNSAEKAATHKLEEVNDYCSKLIVQRGKLSMEAKNMVTYLANLKLQLMSSSEMLQTHKRQLNKARNDVISKHQVLIKLRDRMNESDENTMIGIGLMFIPFIGPLIGSTLIGVSQVDLNNASDAAETATRVLHDAEANANRYSRSVSDYESQIRQKRYEKHRIEARLDKIVHDIKEVSRLSTVILKVQENLRLVTNILGQLSGGASVAEVQTRKFICLEPLVLILAETAQKMSQISGNEKYRILQVNNVKPLVTYLNENLPKLKAICYKENEDY